MIIRLLARRPDAIRASLATASGTCRTTVLPLVRRKHTVPTLTNHLELKQNGIPGLLSPRGFNTAYIEYMEHMTSELNAATDGTPLENSSPQSVVLELARNPVKAYEFNVASMAWNNHFFFNGINVDANIQSVPSSDLLSEIKDSFSSLDTLRETFLTTAEAMFGPGFVWLVQTNERTDKNPLRILPTYIAGTPLSGAHYRRQSKDLNTENPDSYQASNLNKVGAFGLASKTEVKTKKALGGVDIIPLLCVNTWEHVWLHDYGIAGKRQYLERWWDTIDWNKVREHITITPNLKNQFNYDQRV